jgi:hypothetical protein
VTSKLNLRALFIKLLLFLIPTQLAYHFWPSFAFVFGFRIDYLAPAIYLTDLLIIIFVFDFLFNNFNLLLHSIRKNKLIIIFTLLTVATNILFSLNPMTSLIKWLKILELTFFAFCLAKEKNLKINDIQNTLFWSAVFFSTLGLMQFISGKTLGLEVFGERAFSGSTPGIALVSLFGKDFLRAYSTFGHPNAAAGFYGVTLIWSFFTKNFLQSFSRRLGYFLLISGFVLTFSRGAFLSVAIVYLYMTFIKNRGESLVIYLTALASLLFVFVAEKISMNYLFAGKEIQERISLAKVSLEISGLNFLTGVGLNNFIPAIPTFNETAKNIWLLQPVHNIFLLSLSEGGIVLTLALIVLLSKLSLKKGVIGGLIIFIILTGFFDHYWLTLQQNLLLLSVVIASSFKKLHVVG